MWDPVGAARWETSRQFPLSVLSAKANQSGEQMAQRHVVQGRKIPA